MNNDDLITKMMEMQDSIPSDEQVSAQEAINAANDIEMTVNTNGWLRILDKFEDIKIAAEDTLFEQIPGDDKAILAAFSVAYAVRGAFTSLLEAVQDIRASGNEAREFLKYQSEVEDLDEYN